MIQILIVALIVAFCAWQVGKKFWPKKAAAPSVEGGCGSGGCDTCGACKTLSFEPVKD
ncbi:MAG: hypothetical protein JF615_04085 [Asticcacaulis sp.]|nr:hypothetical protein [Asticcacaulis sp.]